MPPIVAALPLIIAAVGAASAAGGAAYSIQSGMEKKSEAKDQAMQQQNQLRQAEQQKMNEAKVAEQTILRDRAREKQRIDAGLSSGRAGTILTGPQGVAGTGSLGGQKTLLGQ